MTQNIDNSDPSLILRQIDYLAEFMMPERLEGLRHVLAERTKYMTICMENTFHPQNASALIRNCEAFGIQQIHTVETLCAFSPHVRIVRGTDKWIDIQKHETTRELIHQLREDGYRIVATTPHTDDTIPETFDVTQGKFALFFGTEHAGISDEVKQQADEFIRIPMCGFVESLNVSASAAILLYMLSQRIKQSNTPWQLPAEESNRILLEWMMKSVKDAEGIMTRFR